MSKNSIMDNNEENYDVVIHGRTIRDIIEQQLVLTSDIETGHCYWITKEEAQARKELWRVMEKNLVTAINKTAKVLIYGTAGDGKDIGDLEKMFYDPETYKVLKETPKGKWFIPAWENEVHDKWGNRMDGLQGLDNASTVSPDVP